METRVCKDCGKEQSIESFNFDVKNGKTYYRHRCKSCQKKFREDWLAKNIEKERKRKRLWVSENRNTVNAYRREKWENDELYKYKELKRTQIGKVFRRKGITQSNAVMDMLGCDGIEFYNHLLKTYLENYGERYDGTQEVNIDHIVPLATAKTKEDVYMLFHFTNLQLLKAEDNMEKSTSLSWSLGNKN